MSSWEIPNNVLILRRDLAFQNTILAQVAVPGDDGSLMVDPLAVRDALYGKVGFQGLSGFISCSEVGDCSTTSNGRVYQFTCGDPSTYNPGSTDLQNANPVQVWP